MIKKMATSTVSAFSSIITWIIQRTFNPLAAGSIPARPTKIKDLQGPAKKATSTNVHIWAAAGVAFLLLPGACFAGGWPTGWDFYFFGINTKMIKEADYKMVALGAASALAVHVAGHYAYAGINGINVRQDGINEVIGNGYSAKQYREFAQAGFAAQHVVGLILTSIPATRSMDFTRGYVGFSFFHTLFYPLHAGKRGDLYWSDVHGGDADIEYFSFLFVATHNVLRVKWTKE